MRQRGIICSHNTLMSLLLRLFSVPCSCNHFKNISIWSLLKSRGNTFGQSLTTANEFVNYLVKRSIATATRMPNACRRIELSTAQNFRHHREGKCIGKHYNTLFAQQKSRSLPRYTYALAIRGKYLYHYFPRNL